MRRRGERGTTLVEVMIAGLVLLVALLGFAGMASSSAASTGVAHRRSSAAYMNAGLLDRYLVASRTAYAGISADTWIVDTCYDRNAQVVQSNPTWSTTFTCDPANGSFYQTWISITGTGPWVLSTYAERIDVGCTPATRYASLGCVAADVYLSD
jgi:Tfp pilus assembly protein PilV